MTTLNVASDEIGINPAPPIEKPSETLSWRNYLQTIILALITVAVAAVGGVWYMQGQTNEALTSEQAYAPLPVYESTMDVEPAVVQSITSNAVTTDTPVNDDPLSSLAEKPLAAASVMEPEEAVTSEVVETAAVVSAFERSTVPAAGAEQSETITNFSLPSIVRSGGADLMTAPDGEVVMTLATGDSLMATERTEDNGWIYVQVKKGIDGWISADQTLTLNVKQLPVAMSNLDGGINPELETLETSLPLNGDHGLSQLMTTLSSLELPAFGDVTAADVANN